MDKIDILKKKLNQALEEKGIGDSEVPSISRELDILIVEHLVNNLDGDTIIDENNK